MLLTSSLVEAGEGEAVNLTFPDRNKIKSLHTVGMDVGKSRKTDLYLYFILVNVNACKPVISTSLQIMD